MKVSSRNILFLSALAAVSVTTAVVFVGRKETTAYVDKPVATEDVSSNESPKEPAATQSYACKEMLEENANDLAMVSYSQTESVDCYTTGCGGIF